MNTAADTPTDPDTGRLPDGITMYQGMTDPRPRLSPHVELFITDRIARLVDDVIDQHSLGIAVTDVWKRQVVRNASAEIVRKVAEYIDSREISALSSLSSAKYHIDKVRKSIEDRRP